MELKFTLNTDDLYGEDGIDFESLLADSLKRAIIKDAKAEVASAKFKEFSQLASDSLVAEIKVRLSNFLSEEISITEQWGKPTFVGSIEDLIKKRFDDVLLRPVDTNGKTLQGCTSSGKTWIEWEISNKLEDTLKAHIKNAQDSIRKLVSDSVSAKIIEIKNSAIKAQVDDAFAKFLKG